MNPKRIVKYLWTAGVSVAGEKVRGSIVETYIFTKGITPE